MVDALQWVRSRPEMFFPLGRPTPVHLLAYLMADVLVLGGGSCTIRQQGGFWLIGSEVDWLRGAPCSEVEVFSRVVPAPQHGEHSMRGEVLVSAFAGSVWLTLDARRTRIQGDEPPSSVWDLAMGLRRTILFGM